MVYFVKIVRFFMNYVIFRELCDRMRFEVDCAKSHHRIISEGLYESACGRMQGRISVIEALWRVKNCLPLIALKRKVNWGRWW